MLETVGEHEVKQLNQTIGGLGGNRTPIQGFAVLCVTIPPRGLICAARIAEQVGGYNLGPKDC